MKKRLIVLLLALCFAFVGCKNQKTQEYSDTPISSLDAQNQFVVMNGFNIQETEKFFFGCGLLENYLHYYDKESHTSGILCADPSCIHDTESCWAYVEEGSNLSCYDGKLYFVARDAQSESNDYYLWRSDLTGTNRERVKRFDFLNVIVAYNPQRFVIHRGNLYILGSNAIVDAGDPKNRITLLSIPLDGSEEFTTILDRTVSDSFEVIPRFVENKVYYAEKSSFPNTIKLVSYDIAGKNTQTLWEGNDSDCVWGDFWVTEEEQCYLSGMSHGESVVWKLEGGELVKGFSREVGNTEEPWIPHLFGGLAVWSSYESEVRYISVKDLQGRTLYEGKLFPQTVPGVPGDPNKYQWGIVGGDGEKLIVNLHSFSEQGITSYMLSLDLRDNLKPTVLWSNEC